MLQADGRTDEWRTDRRTDGWSGLTIRPAFAKAMQVKTRFYVIVPCFFSTYFDGCDFRTKCDPNCGCDLILSVSHLLYV